MCFAQASGHAAFDAAAFGEVADAAARDTIWMPGAGKYGRAAGITNSERLASVQGEFDIALAEMTKEAQRAQKLDQKVPQCCSACAASTVTRANYAYAWRGTLSASIAKHESGGGRCTCKGGADMWLLADRQHQRVAACAQVTLVTKGLVDREAKLRKTTEDLWQQATAANQELTCFRALAANEVLGTLWIRGLSAI